MATLPPYPTKRVSRIFGEAMNRPLLLQQHALA